MKLFDAWYAKSNNLASDGKTLILIGKHRPRFPGDGKKYVLKSIFTEITDCQDESARRYFSMVDEIITRNTRYFQVMKSYAVVDNL